MVGKSWETLGKVLGKSWETFGIGYCEKGVSQTTAHLVLYTDPYAG